MGREGAWEVGRRAGRHFSGTVWPGVLKRKSDVQDARWLADLLAHGPVRASFAPPAPQQALRELTRTLKQLVREAAAHALRIHKLLENANLKLASIHDTREDRAVSPVHEERREARRVRRPWVARAGDRALLRALQHNPPLAVRVAAQRDAGGCLPGAAGGDLGPPCADQTPVAGTAKAEAGNLRAGMTTATRRECAWLTNPNGPEESDDLHLCPSWRSA